MNLSIWDVPKECYMIEKSRRPFPVMPSLTSKRKGEAPKCKTCVRLYSCTKSHGTMSMACERYERKKKKKKK